jgi:hypothetical protein
MAERLLMTDPDPEPLRCPACGAETERAYNRVYCTDLRCPHYGLRIERWDCSDG